MDPFWKFILNFLPVHHGSGIQLLWWEPSQSWYQCRPDPIRVSLQRLEFESIHFLSKGPYIIPRTIAFLPFLSEHIYQETFFSIFWICLSRNNSYHPSDRIDGKEFIPIHFLSLFRHHIRFDFIKLLMLFIELRLLFIELRFVFLDFQLHCSHLFLHCFHSASTCSYEAGPSFEIVITVLLPSDLLGEFEKIPYSGVVFIGSYVFSCCSLSRTSPTY